MAAAAVLTGLVFTAALVVATAQDATVRGLRLGAPAVRRWGGWILLGVGGWFIVLGVWADAFAGVFPV